MDELAGARIDALDKKASRIEDVLFGDEELSKDARRRMKAELAQVYADMAVAVDRFGASLKAPSRFPLP